MESTEVLMNTFINQQIDDGEMMSGYEHVIKIMG